MAASASLIGALRSPCFQAFMRLRALPSGVLGPVDCLQGSVRLAASWRLLRPFGESVYDRSVGGVWDWRAGHSSRTTEPGAGERGLRGRSAASVNPRT